MNKLDIMEIIIKGNIFHQYRQINNKCKDMEDYRRIIWEFVFQRVLKSVSI